MGRKYEVYKIHCFIFSVGLLSCQMSATPSSSSEIQVSDILIEKTSYVIEVGSTESISCKIVPENATNKTITWKSLNSSIVTVNNGTIKGIAKGDTKISITCGKIEKEIEVSVVNKKIRVSSFTVSPESKSIVVGDEFSVVTTVTPENATDKTITWQSDNTEIATVDSGKIKGVSAGTANITATCDGIEKTIRVTVNKQKVLVSGFELATSSVTIGLGDEFEIATSITPENATDKTIIWESENEDCVSVSEGIITGVGIGSTKVYATCGGIKRTVSVVVKEAVINVSSILLSKTELYLNTNQTVTIVASVLPENATDKSVSWKTSDSNIATVQDGIITGKNYGTATITATSGNCSAEVVVTVCIPVENINLSTESITLNIGDSRTVTATVYPENSTDKTVVWTSSNESVATVNNGTIKAMAGGSTTITATCGGVSNSVSVKVLVPVTSITLSETSISVVKDGTYKLKATVNPINSTEQSIAWISNDDSIATVVDGVITGVSEGTTSIEATCDGKSASVIVTVTPNSGTIEPTSLLLSESALTMKVGETYSVVATINPTNAENKIITWTSTDETVATVNYGAISAVGVGTATITASCGLLSKSLTLTVENNIIDIAKISISPSITSITVGTTKRLDISILPTTATDKTITWTTSDSTVASVSSLGYVTGKKVGNTTIRATSKSGVFTEALVIVVNEGYSVDYPDNYEFDSNSLIKVSYKKAGNKYYVTAKSPVTCDYLDFYVNGLTNGTGLIKEDTYFTNCKEKTIELDTSTYEKRYITVFVFGIVNQKIIGSEELISIDLLGE